MSRQTEPRIDRYINLGPKRTPVRRKRRGPPRRGRVIDDAYRAYIASLPCCLTNAPPPSDPHHVRVMAGMSTKPPDYDCVPLAHEVHRYLEDHGMVEFEKRYGVTREDLLKIAAKLKAEYDATR